MYQKEPSSFRVATAFLLFLSFVFLLFASCTVDPTAADLATVDSAAKLASASGKLAIKRDEAGRSFVANRLLVKFNPGVDKGKRDEVLHLHGARSVATLEQIAVHVLALPSTASETAVARAMRARPEVDFSEVDQIAEPVFIPDDPLYAHPYYPQWHLPKIGCPAAWEMTVGNSDLKIAILDSGIFGTHEDLSEKLVLGWNVRYNNSDTRDVNTHGTLVAGSAAAISNNGVGVAAPCWGCKMMPMVVADSNGYSTSSILASGLLWARDHGAKISNMSFGYISSTTLTNAAQYFQAGGGLVIMSAGNSGVVNTSPDNLYIVTVSATDKSDLIASWSTTGNCIDLAAPGVEIITTSANGAYASASGTSFSAPIVAGVAALIMSVNPSLSPHDVEDILKQSADDFGPAGWDQGYGWGRLNAARAVQMAEGEPPADRTPPTVSFTFPLNGASVYSSIKVQIAATDNVIVSSVNLKIDGASFFTDTMPPYEFYLNTTSLSNGSHTLLATATDAAANSATTQIMINVNNAPPLDTIPPSVSITSPQNGQRVSGIITIQATASDNVAVQAVNFYVDGILKGSDPAAPFYLPLDTKALTNTSHTCSIVARDAAGNQSQASIVIYVANMIVTPTPTPPPPDTIAPTVSILSPANGANIGTKPISISIKANDNIGVVHIELYIDGSLFASNSSNTLQVSWNPRKVAKGAHSIQAKAYDATGNIGISSSVMVYK